MRAWIFLLSFGGVLSAQPAKPTWKFAVSGDSRNCGDIVMPAIAAAVEKSHAEFYWHLGDLRAFYEFDEDMVPPADLHLTPQAQNISDYFSKAWPDMIQQQIAPFGDLPFYIAMGNHETIPPASRAAWLVQFADWLEAPNIRKQRLTDDPVDHKLHAYYHWHSKDGSIDFLTLDNASEEQFDKEQLAWIHRVLAADENSTAIKTVVVGMHAALPGSIGHNHSMSDWLQGDKSGREVYTALFHTQDFARKHVYILASHSHFYMERVYSTSDWAQKEIPGWIVGTAGAVRYRLPALEVRPENKAETDIYGFLLATVMSDSSINFQLQKLDKSDLTHANPSRPEGLINWCVENNKLLQ